MVRERLRANQSLGIPRAEVDQNGLCVIDQPSFQERVFFEGTNGTGKTVLASQMLAPFSKVIILDVKWDFPIPWPEGEYVVVDKPPGFGFVNSLTWNGLWGWSGNTNRIVYRPARGYDSGQNIAKFLDWVFDQARRAGKGGKKYNGILYVDEGLWASYQGAWLALARLAVAARGVNLGLWMSSQRPAGIPVAIRTEAWRWYIFYTQGLQDRKAILEYLDFRITLQDLDQLLANYCFIEVRRTSAGRREYRLYPPVVYQQS